MKPVYLDRFSVKVKTNINLEVIFTDSSLFLKSNMFLKRDIYCIIEEHKFFKEFSDSRRLLNGSQNFRMLEVKKISDMSPKSWEKLFYSGVIIPLKKRFCIKCTNKLTCNRCNSQVNINKEFEANIIHLKKQ